MKAVAICSTSIVAIFLGTSLLANAQPDHRGRDNDRQDRRRGNAHQQEHSRPSPSQHGQHEAGEMEQRHDQGRGPREAVQRGPERPMQYRQPAPGHFREASRREPEHFEHRDIWQRQRAQHWQREHRPWHERGGYHGYRIPQERFRAHFGRAHCFRVHEVPVVVVERYPRFQFSGFWFSLVDPWPETWAPTWYRTDEVYIDYVNDGYYLYNRQHPGVSIAVNVSL
jgi:hypothetical protein